MRHCAGTGGWLASAALIMVLASPANAQTATRQDFNLPARPLAEALREFGRQAGQPLLYSDAHLAGLWSQSVHGRLTASQALDQLLGGNRLTVTRTPQGVLLIKPTSGSAKLRATQTSMSETRLAVARPAPLAPSAPEATVARVDEEIVVTAQKREQRLQDVPVSVSVASGDALQRANINNVTDLSSRMPNIRITPAPAASQIYMRGVGSGLNAGFEQAVGTFVDGVYRGRSRAIAAALFDLERVEVLKGPQTTFFGNNVIAGALNIVTRKADTSPELKTTLLYSPSDGEYSLEAGGSIPLTDTLRVRLAAKAYGMDGFAYNVANGGKVPHQRDWIGRISAVWEPNDVLRSDLRVDRGRLRDRGSPAVEGMNCPADPAYGAPRGTCLRYLNSGQPIDDDFDYRLSNFDSYTYYDFVEVALTNNVDLGGGVLTSVSSYFQHEADNLSDAAPFPVGGVPPGTLSATTINSTEEARQYSQEVRFASAEQEDRPFSYMIGGYFARLILEGENYNGLYQAAFGALAAPIYNATTPVASFVGYRQTSNTWSGFGSATYRFAPALSLDLGLRYTQVDKTGDRRLAYGSAARVATAETFVPGPAAVQAPLAAALGGTTANYLNPTRRDRKLMPSVKIRFTPDRDVLAYASYTRGFKAGGYAVAPGNNEFAPEQANAYELGFKATLLDGRLFTSLTLFQTDYSDLQEATQVVLPGSGAIVSLISNAAGARSRGVEFAANWRIAPILSLNMDVAYLDARYNNYPNAPCTTLANLTPGCVQDMSGKRRAFSPKFSGNFGASLALPVGQEGMFRLDPTVYFSSRHFQSATADPLFEQSGYAKVDLRASIGAANRSWELAVIGKNLTDKATASLRNSFAGSPGTIWFYPERPRSVAVQFSFQY